MNRNPDRSVRRRAAAVALALAGLLALTSCSPYASVGIGYSFNSGSFYVNPSIGIGGFL